MTRQHNTTQRWQRKPGSLDPLHLQQAFLGLNAWGIPDILPQPPELKVPDTLITYNYRERFRTTRPIFVHFHADDYRFESVWTTPQKGIASMQRAGIWAAGSPDFSLWLNAPLATQLWQTYRNRWVGRLWQFEARINIIPTISWGLPESYNFCFSGVSKGQIINLRTYKTYGRTEKAVFLEGYKAMLDALEPRHILWFGEIFDEIHDNNVPKTKFDVGHWANKKRTKGAI